MIQKFEDNEGNEDMSDQNDNELDRIVQFQIVPDPGWIYWLTAAGELFRRLGTMPTEVFDIRTHKWGKL